uniref:PqqD family protein n=1 Tax=Parerythrobacter lutipelagi TaxID=1964208 RepID=UPI0010F8A9EB|nr:PqqD family protein [Parerythrobacter lutipelagi]
MSTLTVTPDSVVTRNEDVLYSEVADGMSLMDIESGRYFHFEPTGSSIWLKLAPDQSIADLCGSLEKEFEVEPEQCRIDTIEFVTELYGLGLVKVDS